MPAGIEQKDHLAVADRGLRDAAVEVRGRREALRRQNDVVAFHRYALTGVVMHQVRKMFVQQVQQPSYGQVLRLNVFGVDPHLAVVGGGHRSGDFERQVNGLVNRALQDQLPIAHGQADVARLPGGPL
jgi:hypothetical protein